MADTDIGSLRISVSAQENSYLENFCIRDITVVYAAMTDKPAEREIIRCSMCKKDHFTENFDLDRLGHRRKTCRDCKKRRAGALVGAAFQNRCQNKLATKGLTIDDLNNFRYAGGDGGRKGGLLANSRHLKYFRMCRGTPDGGLEDLPDHLQHCDICDHTIVENCYLASKETNAITLVVGNCCIKRFVADAGRTCDTCGEPHRNQVANRCNTCRLDKCDRCGVAKSANAPKSRKLCNRCYFRDEAQPAQALVEAVPDALLATLGL